MEIKSCPVRFLLFFSKCYLIRLFIFLNALFRSCFSNQIVSLDTKSLCFGILCSSREIQGCGVSVPLAQQGLDRHFPSCLVFFLDADMRQCLDPLPVHFDLTLRLNSNYSAQRDKLWGLEGTFAQLLCDEASRVEATCLSPVIMGTHFSLGQVYFMDDSGSRTALLNEVGVQVADLEARSIEIKHQYFCHVLYFINLKRRFHHQWFLNHSHLLPVDPSW